MSVDIHPDIEVGTIAGTLRASGKELTCRVGALVLTARLVDDRFVFSGGLSGDHSLAANRSVTSVDRLLAHWRGYCENNIRRCEAERILRTIVDQEGLRIGGVPEVLPSAQEAGAIVLRVEIRVPAARIDQDLKDAS